MTVFIDTTGVAALLGQSSDLFLRNRRRLEDDEGFPLPMPHWQRPLKWRKDQILGWIEAKGRPRADTPPLPPNVVRLFERARLA